MHKRPLVRVGVLALSVGLSAGCVSKPADRTIAQQQPANTSVAQTNLSERYGKLNAEFPGVLPQKAPANDPIALAADLAEQEQKPSPFQKVSTVFKSGAAKTASALSIKPRVVEATDPISLSHSTGPIGEELYMQVGRLHEKQGNYPQARSQYKKALEIKPDDLTILLSYARLCDLQNDHAAALKAYQDALEKHPQSALAMNDMALCVARQGDIERSLSLLQRAVELEPQSERYRNNIATVLVESGRPEEALSQLKAVYPEAVAHYNVGFLLHKRGRHDAALAFLDHAAKLDPSFNAVHALVAQIHAGSDAAVQTARHAARQAPASADDHLMIVAREIQQAEAAYSAAGAPRSPAARTQSLPPVAP